MPIVKSGIPKKYELHFTKQVDHTLFRIITSILLRAGFGTPATLMLAGSPLDQMASPPARPRVIGSMAECGRWRLVGDIGGK